MEANKRDADWWSKVKKSLDILFARSEGADETQQQILAQLEITAKAVNQVTQDQALMAKQLLAAGDAVSRLTHWQMRMEAADSVSKAEDVNPFSPDPGLGTSTNRPPPAPHRSRYDQDRPTRQYLPKMSFPKFDGENPTIWRDKCQEYFKLYNIPDSMKTSVASLHLEGNVAKWY